MQSGKHAAATGTALAVSAAAVPAALAGAAVFGSPAAVHAGAVPATLDAKVTTITTDPVPSAQIHITTVREAVRAAVRVVVSPSVHSVITGDTLSAIARQFCGTAGKWPALFRGNQKVIGADPNLILPGQKITLTCSDPYLYPAVAASASTASSVQQSDPAPASSGEGCDGDEVACSAPQQQPAAQQQYQQPAQQQYQQPAQQQAQQPVQASATITGASGTVSTAGMGSFQSCVIARESGGNSQVMNSTGHYGLYQFDLGTWESGGGSAATFGNASVAEQNAVFNAVYAARGTNPWAPYDGC